VNVFISYSTGDRDLVRKMADELKPSAQPVYWDQDNEPGKDAWDTIRGWIESADLVVAVITDKAVSRAMSVGNEVGIAKEMGKPILPLVGAGVESADLGCLQGVTFRRIDNANPGDAVMAVQKSLVGMLQEQLGEQMGLAVERGDWLKVVLLIAGVVGLIWLLSQE